MKTKSKWLVFILLFSFILASINVQAADDRLGTIVDGSLLIEDTVVEGFSRQSELIERGTYLSNGNGRLSNNGNRSVNVYVSTSGNRTCDQIKVTLYLQRLVGNSWVTDYTLGPKTATNSYFVSNSKNYTVTGGYYYRVKGSHTAIKGTTTESTSSYTDGLWIK